METIAHRGRERKAARPRAARDGKGVPGKRQRSSRIPERGGRVEPAGPGAPASSVPWSCLEDSGPAPKRVSLGAMPFLPSASVSSPVKPGDLPGCLLRAPFWFPSAKPTLPLKTE